MRLPLNFSAVVVAPVDGGPGPQAGRTVRNRFWHHLSSALGDAAIAHIRVLFAYTFYDFLLVFSDDLTSCWNRCRVTSRRSRQVVIPRPKKEQENEQRHEESDKPLSLDATQLNSRHRGDNSGRLSQQRPTPTIIIIIR